MNTDTSYPKCDEASIKRITTLVDERIHHNETTFANSKKHYLLTKKVALVATIALFALSSLTFATNIDLPVLLRQAYNQLFPNETMANKALNYMQPLEGSSIFNGIKAQLIGYIRDNDIVYVTFSLQDLEGDRLDETTFIYDYSIHGYASDTINPYGRNALWGYNAAVNIFSISPVNSLFSEEMTLVNYEPTTKTATFNYRFSHSADNLLFEENSNREFFKRLELVINLIASGAKEGEASYDFKLALTNSDYSPTTIQADFDDFRRNGYSGYSNEPQTFLMPDEMRLTLLNVPGVVISNYGIIDDRLHVLIKYERPRDLCINRILDMSLKVSKKNWDAQSDFYLKDGESTGTVCKFTTNGAYYAEYIFDLPKNYTADDLEVLYHYRTYDYIIGMDDNDLMSLPEDEVTNALWHLDFNPDISLEERAIPFKIIEKGQPSKTLTAYTSSIGLMLDGSPDSYSHLYYETFNQKMQIALVLEDGAQQLVTIDAIDGYSKSDETGKTKFLFSDFIDITHIKQMKLVIP